ncbi:hypothetical protein RB597_009968 [Gaeumannomyces tritici]
MSSFEQTITQAVEDREVPPVVLIAGDKTGKLNYCQSYGSISLEGAGTGPAIRPSSTLAWMSLTKLPTVVAVLQLVGRGALPPLDDPAAVPTHLPELAALPVLLAGDDDGGETTTTTTPRTAPLTLRHLLTHTSGLAYPFLPGPLADLLARRGANPLAGVGTSATVAQRFAAHPLVSQPGAAWAYGPGLDWAGLLLERVTGRSLEAHLREHVWAPLGLAGDAAPTFFPSVVGGGGDGAAVVATSARDPKTGKVGPLPTTTPSAPRKEEEEGACLGGEGLHGSADALARLLASLLADDGAVLARGDGGGAAALFEPQLAGAARGSLLAQLERPEWIAGHVPPNGGEYNWALGGLVVEGDGAVAGRRRGCLMWGGMYNSSWILDREAGLYGIYATQTLPPGDAKVREMTKAFHEELYSKVKQ